MHDVCACECVCVCVHTPLCASWPWHVHTSALHPCPLSRVHSPGVWSVCLHRLCNCVCAHQGWRGDPGRPGLEVTTCGRSPRCNGGQRSPQRSWERVQAGPPLQVSPGPHCQALHSPGDQSLPSFVSGRDRDGPQLTLCPEGRASSSPLGDRLGHRGLLRGGVHSAGLTAVQTSLGEQAPSPRCAGSSLGGAGCVGTCGHRVGWPPGHVRSARLCVSCRSAGRRHL